MPETGIEPASVAPAKSTPIYTYSRVSQPAVRRMALFITAQCAANKLRMRRLRLIISA